MLSEKALRELRQSMVTYLPLMHQAATTVKDKDISNYPVFVLYKEDDLAVGLSVVAPEKEDAWSVNLSTLEELAAKKIVAMENVERFTSVYKSNVNALCCLVWQKESAAQFVFIPFAPNLVEREYEEE